MAALALLGGGGGAGAVAGQQFEEALLQGLLNGLGRRITCKTTNRRAD